MTEPNRLYIVTHRDGTHERLIAAQDANHVRQFVTIVRKAKAEDVARILMGGGTIEHADTTANPHPDQSELPLVDPADAAPGRVVLDLPAVRGVDISAISVDETSTWTHDLKA